MPADGWVAVSNGVWFEAGTKWHEYFASPSMGRSLSADVYVAPASSLRLARGWRWSDWFAFGTEVPMPAVLW